MPKKRILIFPNTNTLSHFTRALALAEWLDRAGFETHIGLSGARRFWATRFRPRCHRIRELWEPSGIPFPCLQWFSDRDHIEACVRSQEELVDQVKPRLVIGIFDFLSRISVRSTPLLSVNGACMLPVFGGVLGFSDRASAQREEQRQVIDVFWRYAANACAPSLTRRGLACVDRANDLLRGDQSAIYEINEIAGLDAIPEGYHMAGPIFWAGWEDLGEPIPWQRHGAPLTLYLNSGTLLKDERIMKLIMHDCLSTGARILVSSGMDGPIETSERVFCRPFLPPAAATGLADIVICSGGVGVCYTNLRSAVPSLVVPMQPEQATNGWNLERVGCGRVLDPGIVFTGQARQYERAIDAGRFGAMLREMMEDRSAAKPLELVKRALAAATTQETMVGLARRMI